MQTHFRGLVALVAFALSLGFSPARAVDLFEPVAPAGRAAAAAADPGGAVARQRLVRLNAAAIDVPATREADGKVGADAPATPLRIELFPDTVATFDRSSLEPAFGGGTIWTGDASSRDGVATLVLRAGEVTGQVELRGRIYRISPEAGDVHSVAEIVAGRLPKDGPHLHPPGVTRSKRKAPEAAQAGGTVIVDALFAFTQKARAASRNITSEINLAVALTNQAYKASKIDIKMRLRGTIAVAYNESGVDYTATLYNLTGLSGSGSTAAGRAAFDATRARRNAVGADLVVLIREGGEYCGQGWVIYEPSASSADYGFSQVSRGCIAGYTTAHETGHNMGLNHDRYVEPAAPASQYNFGYVDTVAEVEDIMSYPNLCASKGLTCDRVNRFSNPRIKVGGRPFGIVQGRPGAADASRRLNETRAGVASYRRAAAADADAAAEAEDAIAADPVAADSVAAQ